MDAFGVLDSVLGDYENFVKGFLEIKDDQIRAKVESEIEGGLLWPEPWLALNPAFEPGGTVTQLAQRGVLSPYAIDIFRTRSDQDQFSKEIAFHRHQTDAFEIANRHESYVLTTGTGSGKSMSYIVPIVDRVLREGSGKGVRAIIVYPMNALANSQRNELEKFLGKTNPKVTYARYTGQESRDERERTLQSPPDILLTNYVMLELMLTRPRERGKLISSAENLSFLVLDELHTYRGRQGADVAMLVRRLRGAVESADMQCIGTSATLAGPGTKAEQRQEVANLATRIFGIEIPATNVVGETLRRATSGEAGSAALKARLEKSTPATWDELRTDPLAVWTEQHFGLHTDDEGRLARQRPSKLRDAAKKLQKETGVDEQICRVKLQDLLLAGSRVQDAQGRALFAFKLHQFIGKGDTVYTTLEPAESRYLTTQYQRSAPNRPMGQPLFPLAFCRECGQDFLVVNLDRGGEKFSPRTPNSDLVETPDADGLLLVTKELWPDPTDPALLKLVPEDWVIPTGSGEVLDSARVNKLPNALRVDEYGTITDDGLPVAFFQRLDFCPSCKTSYESTRQSQFSRVASLGTEGRASAVTVLSQSIVRTLRVESSLDKDARKYLAFSDNRQDASLQAGHFNDFAQVGVIRSALYRAASARRENDSDEALTDENLGSEVVKVLTEGTLHAFARDEDTADEPIPRKKIGRALRDVVTYRLWADLKRGWRITMPNLEQTGQLRLAYEGLDALTESDSKWAVFGEPLASADAKTRHEVAHVLLDELRRNLCVDTEFLTEDKFDAIHRASKQWLKDPWAITDEAGIYSGVAYAGSRPKNLAGIGADLYLSGLGAYGRWLRRPNRFPAHKQVLNTSDSEALINNLLKVLANAGILAKIETPKRTSGYQIRADIIQWYPDSGERRAPDPIRSNLTDGRVNPYFRDLYAETARSLVGLEAREHTAQVEPAKRQLREEEFSEARLPVLYCSPTMELGVDIKSLNVVGMRNVPPTPANYAQRSGRAGRSGQPAIALTYCATGNAHDAYYFRRSQDMVAGAVAPPRLELGNQDLVRAHAHSIWLVSCGLDLKASMIELLEIDEPGQPLRAEVRAVIESASSRAKAVTGVSDILTATPEVTSAPWWTDKWVTDTIDAAPRRFNNAADRWRGLYKEAQNELDKANETLKAIGASEASKQRARGRISEARAALDLLKGQVDDIMQGDFYTYRYFASEGFLPGYSFPRLPLSAFIPAQRRTRNGEGDYIQRPRFMAISEFGPGAFIYHEGARYEVNRVSLPARDDGTGVNISEIKRCNTCGYLHEGLDVDLCQHCGAQFDIKSTMGNLMRLLSVKTRRRDRISADEEERQRAGHEIVTTIRFEPHGVRAGQLTSTITAADQHLGTMTYGDTARIRRMNVGLRRRKDKDIRGYVLDTVEGRWCSEADLSKNVHGEAPRYQRVIPFVEDHRNALLLHLNPSIPTDQRMATMYALKRGIEAVYQLENSELAVEALPTNSGEHEWSRLLFFEAAEGGAGVLRRLATEDGQLRQVARKALEILHFNPDTGDDLKRAPYATEDCAQACYDCLLSYGNQWDHQHLDRHCVTGLLTQLAASTVAVGAGGEDRAAQFARLTEACDSDLEKKFLALLEEHGYRLPDESQRTVDGLYVRPDFAYHTDGMDVAVFIDGPIHDSVHHHEKDEQARMKLEDEAGWLVLRFHHNDVGDGWLQTIADNGGVFGAAKAES
ncbi:DEAD/DEAH box helicase [Mycobacteroides chelonae]|uniref:DEAD/DEAH box helicase n=1 Tax=Mycobacteroides chelonae TaxID=1774 RepID=UPI0004AA9F60|nr:DEAD/DEAH box helicase [Mycobacteroides chelonae]MBF9317689.1 DEAD/DEAH box helicase [Mycobacteroides chelonae]OHT72988.1 DEAD/DEAH box helicase [Mycobacteroides chelonae]OHT74474.1 DEAD/DEAH box helicase [Mycobacteroides chelonae]OHT89637.1 DEAD/DEAH box helicase [Mycobacteroides chelonae]